MVPVLLANNNSFMQTMTPAFRLSAEVVVFVVVLTWTALTQLVSAGTLRDAFDFGSEAYGLYKKAKSWQGKVAFGYKTIQYCQASGASNCPIYAGLCIAYKVFLESKVATNFIFASYSKVFINHYCLGEPVLKCCRKTSGGYCWSAFNEPRPINCEGNPYYGPTYSPGLCLAPCDGCPGCLCNYLADCDIESNGEERAATTTATPYSSYPGDSFHFGRMDSFYHMVSNAISDLSLLNIQSSSSNASLVIPSVSFAYQETFGLPPNGTSVALEILDFIRYRGCSNYISNADLLESDTGYQILNFAGHPSLHGTDLIDELVGVRAVLPHYAIARLAMDIPQFWQKVDYILGTTWTATSRTTILTKNNITDPEFKLLQFIDFGGVNLLKQVLPDNWVLLALSSNNLLPPPVNGSLWTPGANVPTTGSFHCQNGNGRGNPVQVTQFSLSKNGNSVVSLMFGVKDPELSGPLDASVCWGDRSICGEVTLNNGTATVTHTYLECGTYSVSVRITNKSGLKTIALKTVQIPCHSSDTEVLPLTATVESYPSLLSVDIQLNVTKIGNPFGNTGNQLYLFEGLASTDSILNTTDFNDPNSTEFESFGIYLSSDANNQGSTPVNISVSLDWNAQPLRYIRLTCRSFGNYLYTSAFARITQVSVGLVSGEVVSLPFKIRWNNGIGCSRRGDVFEDDQVFSVIELGAVQDGTLWQSSPGEVNSAARPFPLDGIYFEKLPGRFLRLSDVTPVTLMPTTKPSTTTPRTTKRPSKRPTVRPTIKQTTKRPTKRPSNRPTKRPSKRPTKRPTPA